MPSHKTTNDERSSAPLPRTFLEYVRSFGPGLIVVATWLGAGDIVESSVAGGNYGYTLVWIVVVALVMRFLFVSLIAKYQLCNQHGESVLDGLARLNRYYAPALAILAELHQLPSSRLTPADSRDALNSVFLALPEDEAARMATAFADPYGVPDAEICWAGRTLYQALETLLPEQRGALARVLAAG